MRRAVCSILFLLIGFSNVSFARSDRAADDYSFAEPVDLNQPMALPPKRKKLIGVFRPSFYWVAVETDDGQTKDTDVLDIDGNLLAKVSKGFYAQLRMEGTGKLLDGRMINFKARLTKPDGSQEIRWRLCGPEAPFGYGYEDRVLIPFRTVAIDTKVIPLDRKIYIPAARGAKLPDGSIHDGYFEALDIGSAIINKRVDIFTSIGDQSAVFRAVGLEHGKDLKMYLVQ